MGCVTRWYNDGRVLTCHQTCDTSRNGVTCSVPECGGGELCVACIGDSFIDRTKEARIVLISHRKSTCNLTKCAKCGKKCEGIKDVKAAILC